MLKLRIPEWRVALATSVAVGAASLLVACGGGGDATPAAATPPTTQAASYTQGAITGFGSVFVGGVRYDDSTASVADDDGNSKSRSGDRK